MAARLTKRTRWEPWSSKPGTTHAHDNVSSIDGTAYSRFGAVRIRRPATTVGKLTENDAGTEPSAVTNRPQMMDNEEYTVVTTMTNKEGKSQKRRRKRKKDG